VVGVSVPVFEKSKWIESNTKKSAGADFFLSLHCDNWMHALLMQPVSMFGVTEN